ncbi:Brix domain-containing protein [Scleroderma yunnanense]
MLRAVKPKNARSKRALEAREPKEVEDERMVIFVPGTKTGEVVDKAMKELMALKRPHAISFSKKNTIHPFEDASSLEFWAQKNDASMFVIGQSTKKRPAGIIIARTFDSRVLDMCELGIDRFVSMAEFKTPKSTPGHKPMLHFASDLFDTHPRYIQLKSLLIGFFNGEVIESICLPGLEHVISVSIAPSSNLQSTSVPLGGTQQEDPKILPKVHLRTYTIKLLPSGTRVPRVELSEMGPSIDFSLRRHQEADPEMWKAAIKRPKLKKKDIEQGLGKKKKNLEVDEMGDLRGRIHVAKQDLGRLQTRKMKGLKVSLGEEDGDTDDSASDVEETSLRNRRGDRP